MSLNTQMADSIVNLQADIIATALDDGYLRIYDGTQPATADTAITTQVLLAELRFGNPSEASISGGLITFAAITPDSSANANGNASWFRALKSDGSTVVMDGSAGLASANLILNAIGIAAGATVSVTSFTHDVRNATANL